MFKINSSLKKQSLVALAALLVLCIGGILFYKQRLYYCDASFIAFSILKYKTFCIQEYRYGSFITQLFPYTGQALHWPVNVILKGYAFSFNIFYLLVGIVVYRCRQYGLVIIMAMYYLLLVSDTWYWSNNEIHQAVAWMFLFLAVTLYMGHHKVKWFLFMPIFLMLGFLTVFTHFIVLIPLTFLWGYLWIKREDWPFNKTISIALSLGLACIVAVKFLVVRDNSYDDNHLYNITHLHFSDLVNAVSSGVVDKFFERCRTNYWTGVLLFVAGTLSSLNKKEIAAGTWTLLCTLGYITAMGLTYGDSGENVLLFHIESEWQAMGILLATPFIFSFLPKIKPHYGSLVLAVIFLVRIGYIAASLEKFTWRVETTSSILDQMKKKGITKLALKNDNELMQKYIQSWGLPDESMLMSAMNHDDPQLTVLFINEKESVLMDELANPKIVAPTFEISYPKDWNYEYLKPDTLHPYKVMSYEELFK